VYKFVRCLYLGIAVLSDVSYKNITDNIIDRLETNVKYKSSSNSTYSLALT